MYETEPAEPVEAEAAPVEETEQPEAEAAPNIYESEDFTRAVEERSREVAREELGAMLQEAAQYQEGEEQPEIDFLGDPAEVKQGLAGMMQQIVQQEMAQIRPTVEAFQQQQSQQEIEQMIDKLPAVQETEQLLPEDDRDGVRSAVHFMAMGFLPETEGRYGPGARADETALRMAADQLNSKMKAAHKAGYEARNAELGRLAGAREPAPAGSPSAQLREEPKDEMEAVATYLRRNGLE